MITPSKTLGLLALSLGLFSLSGPVRQRRIQSIVRSQPALGQGKITVRDALRHVARKCDCYLTLEQAWSEGTGELGNNMEEASVPPTLSLEVPRDAFEALTRAVPNLTYQVDPINRKIVHLKDKRLTEKGYALDYTLNSFEFVGNPSDLVRAIAAKGVPVSPNSLSSIGEPSVEFKTVLHVKGTQLTVRDALSEFFPLEKRKGRMLWIASTKLGEHQTAYIKFPNAAFEY